MNTAEQSCGAFLDALASKAPVPGGGEKSFGRGDWYIALSGRCIG